MYKMVKILSGYTCAHRQHGHDGHCAWVHGYSRSFELHLRSENLNENGFVFDFGKFKPVSEWLHELLDHRLLINEGDPLLKGFQKLEEKGGAKLTVLANVSMESVSKLAFDQWEQYFAENGVELYGVLCWENERNAGGYFK